MADQDESKDADSEELSEAADKVQIDMDRTVSKILFGCAAVGGMLSLILLLTGHPILFMLAGFGAVITAIVGVIKLIPHNIFK
ncbi:MAG: hypothetical protein AAF585_15460 [Verrucomicrobiota bacterium]